MGAEEKDLFDKMISQQIRFYYLPTAILYHIIPDSKLTEEHFNKLTYSIGQSEKIRTKAVSPSKYRNRLLKEGVKWAASIVLWIKFLICFQLQKGNKIIQFRHNVTKGLIGR